MFPALALHFYVACSRILAEAGREGIERRNVEMGRKGEGEGKEGKGRLSYTT